MAHYRVSTKSWVLHLSQFFRKWRYPIGDLRHLSSYQGSRPMGAGAINSGTNPGTPVTPTCRRPPAPWSHLSDVCGRSGEAVHRLIYLGRTTGCPTFLRRAVAEASDCRNWLVGAAVAPEDSPGRRLCRVRKVALTAPAAPWRHVRERRTSKTQEASAEGTSCVREILQNDG